MWVVLLTSSVTKPALSQDSILLRLAAPIGSVTRYRTETRGWLPSFPTDSTPSVVMTDVTTESIIAIDGDKRTTSTVMESMLLDVRAGARLRRHGPIGRGRTTVRRIDGRGRVLASEVTRPGAGVGEDGLSDHAGGAFTLPDGPVRVGDSWTATDTMSTGNGTGGRAAVVQVTYRLERIDSATSAQVAVISMNGVVITWFNSRMAGNPYRQENEILAGPASATTFGEIRIDLDAGRMVSLVVTLERRWGTDRGLKTQMTRTAL